MSLGKDIALLVCGEIWDLRLSDGDIVGDDGLESAVAISLFTDGRINDEQLPQFTTDKKGWWADMIPPIEGDKIGSRLWTLSRGKITNENLRLHEDYAREALQWMLDDGVATSIEIDASYDDNFFMTLNINITRPTREQTRFNLFWDNQSVRILNNSEVTSAV